MTSWVAANPSPPGRCRRPVPAQQTAVRIKPARTHPSDRPAETPPGLAIANPLLWNARRREQLDIAAFRLSKMTSSRSRESP